MVFVLRAVRGVWVAAAAVGIDTASVSGFGRLIDRFCFNFNLLLVNMIKEVFAKKTVADCEGTLPSVEPKFQLKSILLYY